MDIQNANLLEIITFTSSICLILGHNLWLVSKNETAEKTKLEINTGDDFPASDSVVKTERIADFKVLSANGEQKISDFQIKGKSLITMINEQSKTAFVAGIELFPHPITLDADRFAHYIQDEDAQIFTAPDFIIGETLQPQRESYAKFAKVLVKNNDTKLEVFTQKLGHKLEIIFIEIPDESNKNLRFQVLFDGNPIKGLRTSIGSENLLDGKYFQHKRTDENGRAEFELTQNGHWFVRTHLIQRHTDVNNFEWESFWASATFYI